MAEWLRRWTANPLGSARVGSNPILVEVFCALLFGVTGSFVKFETYVVVFGHVRGGREGSNLSRSLIRPKYRFSFK